MVSRASLRIGRRLNPEELREMIGACHSVMPRNIQSLMSFRRSLATTRGHHHRASAGTKWLRANGAGADVAKGRREPSS
jgi:hypothetical protein